MEVRRGLGTLPIEDGPTVVTVGFFDGVHLGHRAVIGRTVEAARERGARAAAVTFDRHPREILTPGREPRLLTTLERKIALIGSVGVDVLLVLEFTQAFSQMPAEAFVREVLVEGLHAVHVAVGGDFTFGHRAAGTLQTLRELGPPLGFTAEEVPPFELDGRRVSSSSIREALAAGDLSWPARALGRRYAVEGVVVSGAGRGHDLGFPTANLETSPRLLLPATGIYAGRAAGREGDHVAAVSVGTNPTFGVEPLHVEAFLLDFEGDLRDRPLTVEFWARLRDEERFGSADELVRAMEEDVRRTRRIVPPVER
ncbi:MAG: bifunctional riboflavin kinase/FAD synthetase [Candidatus Velamenicoccus archaeovorus]